jgi:hypothetical protein
MPDTHYRRYTDLPSLIQILSNRQLTLLDPSSWDDKNDSFFLTTYKEKKNLKSALALCFTTSPETYHHWRIFSPGSAGICIHFNGPSLETALHKAPNVKFKKINYIKVDELRKNAPTTNTLPFIKRYPFHPEKEYRALWESKEQSLTSLDIPIELSSITRITLSPWLHPSLQKNIKVALKQIDGCSSIRMWRSTLTENAAWKEFGGNAT